MSKRACDAIVMSKRQKLAQGVALAMELRFPITELLNELHIDKQQWLALKSDQPFQVDVDEARKELAKGNNLLVTGMMSLLPAAIHRLSHIINDPDINPTICLKAIEAIVRESGQSQAVHKPESAQDRFTVTINIPGEDKPVIIEADVDSDKNYIDADFSE